MWTPQAYVEPIIHLWIGTREQLHKVVEWGPRSFLTIHWINGEEISYHCVIAPLSLFMRRRKEINKQEKWNENREVFLISKRIKYDKIRQRNIIMRMQGVHAWNERSLFLLLEDWIELNWIGTPNLLKTPLLCSKEQRCLLGHCWTKWHKCRRPATKHFCQIQARRIEDALNN